jgi:hypothetical protein
MVRRKRRTVKRRRRVEKKKKEEEGEDVDVRENEIITNEEKKMKANMNQMEKIQKMVWI